MYVMLTYFCSVPSILQPGHRLSSRGHIWIFPINFPTIFGTGFFTFDSQDLAVIGKKRSPENFGIKKNNPLEFSNESMIPPCPCSRTAECFETTKRTDGWFLGQLQINQTGFWSIEKTIFDTSDLFGKIPRPLGAPELKATVVSTNLAQYMLYFLKEKNKQTMKYSWTFPQRPFSSVPGCDRCGEVQLHSTSTSFSRL